jgi:hypothetical protein
MFLDKTATLELVNIQVNPRTRVDLDVGLREKVAAWVEKECRLPYVTLVWYQKRRVVTGTYAGRTVRTVRHPATGTYDENDLINCPIDIDDDFEAQAKSILRSGRLAWQLRHAAGIHKSAVDRERDAASWIDRVWLRLKAHLAGRPEPTPAEQPRASATATSTPVAKRYPSTTGAIETKSSTSTGAGSVSVRRIDAKTWEVSCAHRSTRVGSYSEANRLAQGWVDNR